MLINDQLGQELLEAWQDNQNHPQKGCSQKEIPSKEEFLLLLDTLFQASLLNEEGVPVSACVTWVSKDNYEKHEVGQRRASKLSLYFDTPINFEASNLAKLHGITNGKTGSLLAHTSGTDAYIWGICYFSNYIGPIGEIPAISKSAHHLRPDYPTLAITGPGALQITRSGSVIGRVENGKFLRAEVTVLSSYALGQYLYRLIGIEVNFNIRGFREGEKSDHARLFLICIEYLIEVLSQRRIGATIVFIPPNKTECALTESETAWRTQGSLEIARLQNERLLYQEQVQKNDNNSKTLFRLVLDQALRSRLRSLVDLAGIDGALLLTPSFEVIEFGTKLKSQKWEGDIQHGPVTQPIIEQQLDFSRLGTRHNSALNFVGSIEGAVAFIASADGPIRAVVKSTDKKIWYWPDCRLSMFAK